MKKLTGLLTAAILLFSSTQAQEGMWLLHKLKQVNEAEMQELGYTLTAEDIYDINRSGMKDAVVRLGPGFCTGEMVSEEGLMFTNHHCGYGAIQGLSSVEDDILTNGFWAKDRSEEKPVEFGVSFLQRIEDVTDKVMEKLKGVTTEQERQEALEMIGRGLVEATEKGEGESVQFKSMFEGNEFFLFVYKTYRDVRLVGTPPNAIGKFGGDTDNWMWPRHTGDFALFRVYTGPNGEPADYAEANIPYKPKWHFPVSINGVQEGDFAMIMGYPGSTDRYLSSYGVKLALDVDQPSRVKIRGQKLDIMKTNMDASDAVRIQYAAKYAQVSNYWKYFIGQQRGLKRLRVYDKKKQNEESLMAWVNADADRKQRYGRILELLESGYGERAKFEKASTYMQEAAFGSEMVIFGFRLFGLKMQLDTDAKDAERIAMMVAQVRASADEHFKDYHAPTDQAITAAMFRLIHQDVDADLQPDVIETVNKKFKGDFDAWADRMFRTSILTDRGRLDAFLAKPSAKVLERDLGMQTMESCLNFYRNILGPAIDMAETDIAHGYRLMVAAMREKDPERQWYPNANSTMRLTYGQVGSYYPADAVFYKHITTAKGILEKEDPTHDEFIVPERQLELLKARDYGRYADENGDLVVCFISGNDITGGNSGSPVLNAHGELIGIAFDGNWEAMSGDIAFEPDLQRTISVDMRYVLWVIDKYAGAGHLVDEMTVVKGPRKAEAPTEPVGSDVRQPKSPASN